MADAPRPARQVGDRTPPRLNLDSRTRCIDVGLQSVVEDLTSMSWPGAAARPELQQVSQDIAE